jgi:hypothetical protein
LSPSGKTEILLKPKQLSMSTSPGLQQSKSPVPTILLAGFITGTLDACGAMTHYMINSHGGNPLKVWCFVASGALGQDTFTKDLASMAVIGLVFHFIIAFCFTLFFFFIFPKIKLLWKNLIVTGLLYGIFVWLVMNLIIVPLSSIPARGKLWTMVTNTEGNRHVVFQLPPNPTQMIIGILIIMFCVGLPISLILESIIQEK